MVSEVEDTVFIYFNELYNNFDIYYDAICIVKKNLPFGYLDEFLKSLEKLKNYDDFLSILSKSNLINIPKLNLIIPPNKKTY